MKTRIERVRSRFRARLVGACALVAFCGAGACTGHVGDRVASNEKTPPDTLVEQVFASPALTSKIVTCAPASATDAACLVTACSTPA